MQSCALHPGSRPGRPTHRLGFLLPLSLVAAALGCREDAESPTAPESSPALDATAATALAFYQVSGGWNHTCGVTSDNRVYCWGRNSEGQLGDGTTTRRLIPVPIGGTLRFRQISASFSSTCGVTTDYRAYCWGANYRGELGDGTTSPHLRPAPVVGGRQFRHVEMSFEHTCGVTYPSNRVYCWGANEYGQLGLGTNTGPETAPYGPYSSRPVAVIGGLTFRQVSAGYWHTCGVTTDDRVFCWGWNRYGQVGDSSQAWLRLKPYRVAGTRQYRQVDAGRDFTCAVTTGNRGFCWGYGKVGELGIGTASSSRFPKAVAGGLSFERVTAGAFHACGETTLNRAYCWGINGAGNIGDGTTVTRLAPVAVIGGLSFSQLSAGGVHTCGRTPAAVAYCWGGGFEGQLGNGTAGNSSRPVAVAGTM